MKLEGIHHVTAITGRRARKRRLLRARPRAAAREEDRQPGRPHRLPPLLRRRGRLGRRRHHVLRVPGRAARPRRGRHGAPRRLPRRGRAALDFWADRLDREGDRGPARGRLAPVRGPGGPRARARAVDDTRQAARRGQPRHPGRGRHPGLRRGARLHAPTPSGARAFSRTCSGSRPGRRAAGRFAASSAAALRLRPRRQPRHSRCGHRPPCRVRVPHGRPRGVAAARRRRPAPAPRR